MKIDIRKKLLLRRLIRYAIKAQNGKMLFSCEDCGFVGVTCLFDPENSINYSLRQPHQLPKCFLLNPVNSEYANVLEIMLKDLKIDFDKAIFGWPTIVNRVISKTDRFGYLINVSHKNLERFNG